MRSLILFLTCMLLTACLFAQDKDYNANAAKLQKEIWDAPIDEFKSTTVPANLDKESAVILARAYHAQWTSANKFKLSALGMGFTFHAQKLMVFHERVKINDKAALEDFSKIEYQKKLDNSTSGFLSPNITNTKNTFIGAKIIKPRGKEVIVNTSEEVLVKNETKDKQGKLAIPDLQVGDILDYYIAVVDVSENGQGVSFKDNENIFVLANEYPMIYYSIDFQFDKKVKTKYIYANNAPQFEESTDADGNLLLSLKLHNVAKYQSQLWTSKYRQYPYIEIGSAYIKGAQNTDKMFAKESSMFEGNKKQYAEIFNQMGLASDYDIEKEMRDFFGGKKNLKSASLDTTMKVLYDEWKFKTFCMYDGDELADVNSLNYRNASGLYGALKMSAMLTALGADFDVLLVASRESNTLENSYSLRDFDAMVRINGDQPMYMSFNDPMTHFNEIPERFQGESVTVLHPNRRGAIRYKYIESDDVLPVTPSDGNKLDEQVVVSLAPDNMQKLKIERTVKETGSLRHGDQKLLIPVQDVDNGYMEMVKGETLAKRLSHSKETKKKVQDFNAAFSKERDEETKNFTTEIKGRFDQEPKQLTNIKIINTALENTNPVFEYSANFTLDNLVKKAGSNYIIDAGKLTGEFITLDAKERKRSIDIYMPCARTFKYTIVINVPQGYTAKGMAEMNQNKSNKTGSFISSAVLNGSKITITATRVYKNNFEKAADWPLVMELMDAASNFNTKKILFEKNG